MLFARRALIVLSLAWVGGCGDAAGSADLASQPASDGQLAFADGGGRNDAQADAAVDAPSDAAPSDGPSSHDGAGDGGVGDGGVGDSAPPDGSTDGPGPVADSSADAPGVSYTLTVSRVGPGTLTSSPAGISCGATCSASFPAGTQVTLTASPLRFCEWLNGPCNSGSPTCVFTLTKNTSVSAIFASIKFGCP